jgi:DUF1016 N-terminal domain
MRQFHRSYQGHEKLQPLVGEISWTKHLVILGKCSDPLEREFYIRSTKKFGWTKSVLIHHGGRIRPHDTRKPIGWPPIARSSASRRDFKVQLPAPEEFVEPLGNISVSRQLASLDR